MINTNNLNLTEWQSDLERWFHGILPVQPRQRSTAISFYENENARFLLDSAHVMIVSGVICFFGSILVRFEYTDYGTAKVTRGSAHFGCSLLLFQFQF